MPSFRTKRGRCHVEEDRLRVESSFVGYVGRLSEGGWLAPLLVAVSVAYMTAVFLFGDRGLLLAGAGVGVAVVVAANVAGYVRGYRRPDEIALDTVRRVQADDGWVLAPPRFDVVYAADGEERRRRITLPSRYLSYTADEYERGKALLRERGVPVETAS